jgi:hypothetical protein
MAAPNDASSNGASDEARVGESALLSTSERKLRLEEILVSKTEQGFKIESQTDTEATLMTKGSRRWFGMIGSSTETREVMSVDEHGRTHTRAV